MVALAPSPTASPPPTPPGSPRSCASPPRAAPRSPTPCCWRSPPSSPPRLEPPPRPRRSALGGRLDLRLGRLRLRLLGPLRPLPDVPRGDRPRPRLRRAPRGRIRGAGRPRGPALARRRRPARAWSSAARPFYGTLLLPAALAVPAARRGFGVAALVAGAVARRPRLRPHQPGRGGRLDPLLRQRQSFDAASGFPEVDLPARRAGNSIAPAGQPLLAAVGHGRTPARRRGTSSTSSCRAGRRDPPLLPAAPAGARRLPPGRGAGDADPRRAARPSCFLLTRPFNFYGGGGALANRYFLPVYPAFWFAAGRPARASWAVLAAALAAPFLLALWRQPRAFLLDPERRLSLRLRAAQRLLPYETTLVAPEALRRRGLHPQRPLDQAADDQPARRGGRRYRPARSDRPRRAPGRQLRAPSPACDDRRSRRRRRGSGRLRRRAVSPIPRRNGGAVRLLRLRAPPRRPPDVVERERDPVYLYQLRLEAPAGTGFAFQLRPAARDSDPVKKKLLLSAVLAPLHPARRRGALRLLGISAAGRGSSWFAGGNHPRFLFQPDPASGYALPPRVPRPGDRPGREFDVPVARGRPRPAGPAPHAPAQPKVLAIGDSMTFGEGVEADRTYSAVIERPARRAGRERRRAGLRQPSDARPSAPAPPRDPPRVVVMTLCPLWDRQRCATPFVYRDGYIVAQTYLDRLMLLNGNLYLKETRLPVLGPLSAELKAHSNLMRLALPALASGAPLRPAPGEARAAAVRRRLRAHRPEPRGGPPPDRSPGRALPRRPHRRPGPRLSPRPPGPPGAARGPGDPLRGRRRPPPLRALGPAALPPRHPLERGRPPGGGGGAGSQNQGPDTSRYPEIQCVIPRYSPIPEI